MTDLKVPSFTHLCSRRYEWNNRHLYASRLLISSHWHSQKSRSNFKALQWSLSHERKVEKVHRSFVHFIPIANQRRKETINLFKCSSRTSRLNWFTRKLTGDSCVLGDPNFIRCVRVNSVAGRLRKWITASLPPVQIRISNNRNGINGRLDLSVTKFRRYLIQANVVGPWN